MTRSNTYRRTNQLIVPFNRRGAESKTETDRQPLVIREAAPKRPPDTAPPCGAFVSCRLPWPCAVSFAQGAQGARVRCDGVKSMLHRRDVDVPPLGPLRFLLYITAHSQGPSFLFRRFGVCLYPPPPSRRRRFWCFDCVRRRPHGGDQGPKRQDRGQVRRQPPPLGGAQRDQQRRGQGGESLSERGGEVVLCVCVAAREHAERALACLSPCVFCSGLMFAGLVQLGLS